MRATLRLGTRASALALAQARAVADALAVAAGDASIELVPITTHGDVSRASLSTLGGTGVFATALRDALRAGECDLVVHSFKDLPTAAAPGLVIGAVPERADARDVLVTATGASLTELPDRARVGTGSPRRAAQLRAARGDLQVVDLRGNVDSRLARLHPGSADRLDAVVLAAAGLVRLGRDELLTHPFALDAWPTAPAQGALAVEVREHTDPRLATALARLHDPVAAATAAAERGVLAGLEAGCAAPLGAAAHYDGGRLALTAVAYSLDGARRVAASVAVDVTAVADLDAAAAQAAHETVARLLAAGAAELVPDGPRGERP